MATNAKQVGITRSNFMEQMSLYDFIENEYKPSYNINNYKVKLISCDTARDYIIKHHYSHSCHASPSPCYGLFDNGELIGVLAFATPCSESVRACLFGSKYKDNVIELHRLHILDVTPKNAESWFISKCLKLLLIDRPQTWGVISFSYTTQGHYGTIYKATNAFRCGATTEKRTFYIDAKGALHHPRQNGKNITKAEALKRGWQPTKRGWQPTKRGSKNRYVYILGVNKKDKMEHIKLCKLINKNINKEEATNG